jgi:hypothetical protein
VAAGATGGTTQREQLYQLSTHQQVIGEQAYAAAREVAPSVLAHLKHQVDDAVARGEIDMASIPDEQAIARMIDAAFWASEIFGA